MQTDRMEEDQIQGDRMEQTASSSYKRPNRFINRKHKIHHRSKKPVVLGLLAAGALLAAGGFVMFDKGQRVYTRCETEAGTEVVAADFLKNDKYSAVFVPDEPVDTSEVGDIPLKVKSGLFTYSCTLTVYDTTPPEAEPKNRMTAPGEALVPEDFCAEIKDATAVMAAFAADPDFNKKGVQKVSVILKDAAGNETKIEAELVISPIVETITVEAGADKPKEADFYVSGKSGSEMIRLVDGLDKVNTKVPGDYPVTFEVGDLTVTSTVHVEDTTPPELTTKNIDAAYGSLPDPKDFVAKAYDMTSLTYTYAEGHGPTVQDGTQEVVIVATDAAGNSVEKKAKLTMVEDTEPPVIGGTNDLLVIAGKSISYRSNITVKDNIDEHVELQVITDGVDLNTPGTYKVVYVAEDSAGNRAEKEVKLTVTEMTYTPEQVDALAKQVVGQIISPGMGGQQKLRAIYDWVRRNVAYSNDADKSNWQQAAYQGLQFHKGDCYVFACVSKALLNAAGISNMDIQMTPRGDDRHYWNLVNIGAGWYHFDTTPRAVAADFCYVTDDYLMNYSANNGDTHDYDHSLYPQVVGSSSQEAAAEGAEAADQTAPTADAQGTPAQAAAADGAPQAVTDAAGQAAAQGEVTNVQ